MLKYSAVLFDLDGTLLDTLADIAEAANRVLESRSLPTHELVEYRGFVGNGVEMLMERALPSELRTAALVAEASTQFRRVYGETWDLTTAPYPEIPELLGTLRRQGIPLAVLSNKPHGNTQVCVDSFFDATTFAAVFGQRENVPCKPDPATAFEIARGLSLLPSQCLLVGDSNVDMQTAVAAGMTGIGVTWGFRSRKELIESGAAVTIDHPLALLDL